MLHHARRDNLEYFIISDLTLINTLIILLVLLEVWPVLVSTYGDHLNIHDSLYSGSFTWCCISITSAE